MPGVGAVSAPVVLADLTSDMSCASDDDVAVLLVARKGVLALHARELEIKPFHET
jgi:hypothetical protein